MTIGRVQNSRDTSPGHIWDHGPNQEEPIEAIFKQVTERNSQTLLSACVQHIKADSYT